MLDPCYIVGGGTSLKGFDWSLLKDKFTIAINYAYVDLPEANIIYFGDKKFWALNQEKLLEHRAKKVKGSVIVYQKTAEGLQLVENDWGTINHPEVTEYLLQTAKGINKHPQCLAHGNNSVYACINLAGHLGFKTIYLLGLDMKDDGVSSRYHDRDSTYIPEATFDKMKRYWHTLEEPLKELGIEVINLNPDSAIEVFPKKTIKEILGK